VAADGSDLCRAKWRCGAPQRSAVVNLLRGNVIREVSNSLPDEIDLLVYA